MVAPNEPNKQKVQTVSEKKSVLSIVIIVNGIFILFLLLLILNIDFYSYRSINIFPLSSETIFWVIPALFTGGFPLIIKYYYKQMGPEVFYFFILVFVLLSIGIFVSIYLLSFFVCFLIYLKFPATSLFLSYYLTPRIFVPLSSCVGVFFNMIMFNHSSLTRQSKRISYTCLSIIYIIFSAFFYVLGIIFSVDPFWLGLGMFCLTAMAFDMLLFAVKYSQIMAIFAFFLGNIALVFILIADFSIFGVFDIFIDLFISNIGFVLLGSATLSLRKKTLARRILILNWMIWDVYFSIGLILSVYDYEFSIFLEFIVKFIELTVIIEAFSKGVEEEEEFIVPKLDFLIGLVFQIIGVMFLLTGHNIIGGSLLFFMGDLQMLIISRFSQLKKVLFFTKFNVLLWSFYFILIIVDYYRVIFNLPSFIVPEQLVLLMISYACMRFFLPLNNLKKSEYIVFFFNIGTISWLFPLFIRYESFFNIYNKDLIWLIFDFIGIGIIFIGTTGFNLLYSKKLSKKLSLFSISIGNFALIILAISDFIGLWQNDIFGNLIIFNIGSILLLSATINFKTEKNLHPVLVFLWLAWNIYFAGGLLLSIYLNSSLNILKFVIKFVETIFFMWYIKESQKIALSTFITANIVLVLIELSKFIHFVEYNIVGDLLISNIGILLLFFLAIILKKETIFFRLTIISILIWNIYFSGCLLYFTLLSNWIYIFEFVLKFLEILLLMIYVKEMQKFAFLAFIIGNILLAIMVLSNFLFFANYNIFGDLFLSSVGLFSLFYFSMAFKEKASVHRLIGILWVCWNFLFAGGLITSVYQYAPLFFIKYLIMFAEITILFIYIGMTIFKNERLIFLKVNYITGLIIQVAAVVLVLNNHNALVGIILFIVGDVEMWAIIQYTQLKQIQILKFFDLGLWSVYFISFVFMFYIVAYSLPIKIPDILSSWTLILMTASTIRLLIPYLRLNKLKFIAIYLNIIFVSLLITIFSPISQLEFAPFTGSFYNQMILLVIGSIITILAIYNKKVGLSRNFGVIFLRIIVIGFIFLGLYLFFMMPLYDYSFYFPSTTYGEQIIIFLAIDYFEIIIMIWFLYFNVLLVLPKNLDKELKVFIATSYFSSFMLIALLIMLPLDLLMPFLGTFKTIYSAIFIIAVIIVILFTALINPEFFQQPTYLKASILPYSPSTVFQTPSIKIQKPQIETKAPETIPQLSITRLPEEKPLGQEVKEVSQDIKLCKICGAKNNLTNKFCAFCGCKF